MVAPRTRNDGGSPVAIGVFCFGFCFCFGGVAATLVCVNKRSVRLGGGGGGGGGVFVDVVVVAVVGVVATVVPPSTDRLFSTTAPSFPSSFPVSSISISVSVSVSPSPRARFPVPRPSSSSSSLSLPSSRARLPDVTVRSPSLALTSRETSSQCLVTNVATNSRPSATHRSRNASTSSPTDPTRKKHPELRTTFTTRASTSASTALCARFGVTTCEMP